MAKENYIFGGRKFILPKDFESEFRPTKWSIRKFIQFSNTLELDERAKFISHTKHILTTYYIDKDTSMFISQINHKEKVDFASEYYEEHLKIIPNNKVNEFIETMALMKKKGIIKCGATKLAEIIQNQFGILLSISTIKDRIYKTDDKL